MVTENVCIDYFKVEFLRPFEMSDFISRLFSLLRLNFYRYDESRASQFDLVRIYGENTRIMAKPNKTALRKDGEDYFILEMSGAACRSFEFRGGDWKSLLDFLDSNGDIFAKRIDIACDDFAGEVPLGQLKAKLAKSEFVSSFRSFRGASEEGRKIGRLEHSETGANMADMPADYSIVDSKGYSATYGSKASSFQLQIYDKSAERAAKGFDTDGIKWTRFEMRFMKMKAVAVMFKLAKAYDRGNVGEFAKGLLKGCFRIVDNKEGIERSNYNRLPTWAPYDGFLGNVEAIKLPAVQDKVEIDVTRRIRYLHDSVGTTLTHIAMTDPETLFKEIGKSIYDRSRKEITHSEFAKANRYRKSFLGLPEVEEAVLFGNVVTVIDTLGYQALDGTKKIRKMMLKEAP